jgi:NOL1/NOP2/fmu family ribosome biogenesis protein
MFIEGERMRIFIQDKAKKKKFIEQVSQFGIEKIPYLLFKTGNERVVAYSGNLSTEEIMDLWRILPIEGLGLYLGKQMTNRQTGVTESRLSVDALHLLKEQIKNNIIELDEEQTEKWFFGKNIELNNEQKEKYKDIKGFVAVKYKGDFIGNGKISIDKAMLSNFLPKERRRKN